MKKIGMIVAIETDSVFSQYGELEKLPCPQGYELFYLKTDNKELYILHSGMGEVAASAGTQFLIDKCNIELLVNFGVVGGLTEEMKKQKICVVEKVVHYRYDVSEFLPLEVGQVPGHDNYQIPLNQDLVKKALEINPDLKPAICASGDKFVSSKEEKTYIYRSFGANICDMESIGIALTCE
ncbi:MAG: 5'-methylthioadenosine/S-adenosylhomocysteine nucleosidase, partial [Clostridia bacterium]|nr:5'-methylthioadenosine/S-adenosylhomocysteine nucleosidase [Clostridia bacterium]